MTSKELKQELELSEKRFWEFLFATSEKVAARLVPDKSLEGISALITSPAVKMGLVMSLQLQDQGKFWTAIGITLREARDNDDSFEVRKAIILAHGSQEEKDELNHLSQAIQDMKTAVKIAERDEEINTFLGGKEISEEARRFLRSRNYDMASNWHRQLKLAAATDDPTIVVAVVDESQNQRYGCRYTDVVCVWHGGRTASKEFRWRGFNQHDDNFAVRVTSIGEVTVRQNGPTTIVCVQLANESRTWREYFVFEPASEAVFDDPQVAIAWLEEKIKSYGRKIRELKTEYHMYYFVTGQHTARAISQAEKELRELEDELLVQQWYEEFLLG